MNHIAIAKYYKCCERACEFTWTLINDDEILLKWTVHFRQCGYNSFIFLFQTIDVNLPFSLQWDSVTSKIMKKQLPLLIWSYCAETYSYTASSSSIHTKKIEILPQQHKNLETRKFQLTSSHWPNIVTLKSQLPNSINSNQLL